MNLQNQQTQEFGWWLKILTDKPMYIYYFGGFNSYFAAESSKNGYIQDLIQEGSEIVEIEIKQCQPKQLTIPVRALGA